jgi:hypothetical protein
MSQFAVLNSLQAIETANDERLAAERQQLNNEVAEVSSAAVARNQAIADYLIAEEADVGGYKYKDYIGSSISKQIAHIKNMGSYARPTRFFFEIDGLGPIVNERLVRNCVNTTIPGRALQTQPLKIYGPPREYAYEANYTSELQMTFRVGEDMFERDFFEGWAGSVISPMTMDLKYPDSYKTTMRIYQLDKVDLKVYAVELYDVFCKTIGEMELSTDSSDQISTLNVTLSYSEYQTVGKTNFWYDPRKDRGATETTRSVQTIIDERMREKDLDKKGFSQMKGDLKFLLEQ